MNEFIESSVFAKYVYDYLTKEECACMQCFFSGHSEAGDLVPVAGGCRKLRRGAIDKGKRGGVRVIYYGVTRERRIWLLAIYAKSRLKNFPSHVIHLIKEQVVKS